MLDLTQVTCVLHWNPIKGLGRHIMVLDMSRAFCMQHRNPADLIRGLRAQYVASTGGDAQEDGANIPEAFHWLALARDTAQYFKHAPGLSCMLGPMDAEPKVRQCLIGQWGLLSLQVQVSLVRQWAGWLGAFCWLACVARLRGLR